MRVFEDYALPGFWQDPFSVFAPHFERGDRLQASPDRGVAVLGYQALDELGRHPLVDGTPMPSACPDEPDPLADILRDGLFAQTAPRHRALRKASLAGVNRRSIVDFEPVADRLMERRLAALGTAPSDLFHDIALPFTAEAWCAFMGFDADEAPGFMAEIGDLASQFSFAPDASKAAAAAVAAGALLERTRALIETSPDGPACRIADALAEEGGADAAGLIASQFFDAVDTTAAAIAGVLAILMREADPDRLRDQAYRDDAIEEALRLATPATMTVRQARDTFRYRDLTIEAGAMIWMWWAAGDCDPDAFTEPSRFKPGRPKRGLPFGTGAHSCIGHGWAKMLSHVAVRSGLLGRRRLRADTAPIRWTGGGARRPAGERVVRM